MGLTAGLGGAPRARFWEPRSTVDADAQDGVLEPQGVIVDASAIERPRRFSDVRRSAAQQHAAALAASNVEPRPTPPVAATQPAEHDAKGGTILAWNFELPRPEPPSTPEPEPASSQRTWRPLEADESSAGPFA
jgi:PAB1-binding protein PBP1